LAVGVGLGGFVELDSNVDYVDFIGPALIAVFPMWTATAECSYGSFFRMDQQGTFAAILATPVSVDEVTTGEVLWAMTRSVIGVFYVMVMVALFGGINSFAALLIFPFAIVPGIMFGAISLAYTAITKTVSSLNYFFATYITPQFWLSGAFFPLEQMPDGIETAAWFTPAYHVCARRAGSRRATPATCSGLATVVGSCYSSAIGADATAAGEIALSTRF
jgi:lipooligosaccharide transport system permease protein